MSRQVCSCGKRLMDGSFMCEECFTKEVQKRKIFYDIEGNQRTISWMVKNEPEWAANVILSSYTQADLDAAILAERERCSAVLNEMYKERALECHNGMSSYSEGYLDALDLAEQRIKEGK